MGARGVAAIGAKHFNAVVTAYQIADGVFGNDLAVVVHAKAGFHRMLNRDADFNHVTAFGL